MKTRPSIRPELGAENSEAHAPGLGVEVDQGAAAQFQFLKAWVRGVRSLPRAFWIIAVGSSIAAAFACLSLPSIFTYDPIIFWNSWHFWGLRNMPYRSFTWEFPPLSFVPSFLARWMSANSFQAFFGQFMTMASLIALPFLIAVNPIRARGIAVRWLVAGTFGFACAWYRFDPLALVFVCWAIWAIESDRPAALPIVLGFACRLWPALLIVGLIIKGRGKDTKNTFLLMTATLVGWIAWSPSGFRTFLRFRQGKGFEIESFVGAMAMFRSHTVLFISGAQVVRLGNWEILDPVMTVAWLSFAVVLTAFAKRRGANWLYVTGGLVFFLLLSSRLFSAQYIVWGLPFVVLAWSNGVRYITAVYTASCFLTGVALTRFTQYAVDNEKFVAVVFTLRNLLVLWCGVMLIREAFRAETTPASTPTLRSLLRHDPATGAR